MKLYLSKKQGVPIQKGMIGLFFEDINYAADGGLYAEMLENRSFEFMEAAGEAKDYYTRYDGGYAWSAYEAGADVPRADAPCADAEQHVDTLQQKCGTKSGEAIGGKVSEVTLRTVTGSPHTLENPHYMRVETTAPMCGLKNKAYEGLCLKKGMRYHITFWARCVNFTGNFYIKAEKDGIVYAESSIPANAGTDETYNYFRKYELDITADVAKAAESGEKTECSKGTETITGADFVLCLDTPGIVEFDYISMFPEDAVAGLFRGDLFEKLAALKPGFIRFPGGCIVEGNTLDNRYKYKDSLKAPWARKNNWNRWAVHGNNKENNFLSVYSHYNQTLGLGYYEYFLLCELIGAAPLPVVNVGFACQYQSTEQVAVDSPEFEAFLQDALDLIEFANGGTDTKWGAVRAQMGHEAPFNLTMLGVGNEQWQTDRADFFERYTLFEQRIHSRYPEVKLIGSAGPDITSERYTKAWDFYKEHAAQDNFVYAVDEHYYVKPQWLFEHTDFYDNYPREVKVFSGEYAAHPVNGMNRPDANTLEGALAEAAFLTGVERNADVVVLASYAPLFARLGYAQWSPDMIWFDAEKSYGTPSYYVQQMYAANMGDVTLDLAGQEKEDVEQGVFLSAGLRKGVDSDVIILKAVNKNGTPVELDVELAQEAEAAGVSIYATVLTGAALDMGNTIAAPEAVMPCERVFENAFGNRSGNAGRVEQKLVLEPYSFSVFCIHTES